MHIGIIELCEKNHHSMIYNWVKISNINGWKITIFTTQEIYDNVKDELANLNYNVVIKKKNILLFHNEIKKNVKKNKIKKILFLTICKLYIYFFISLKNIPYGITVHNANTWFKKNKIKNFKHFLKTIVIEKIKKNSSFFFVNSKNMKDFVQKNNLETKPLFVLPFSLRKNKILKNNNNVRFTTVYPGGINFERRKYFNFQKLAAKYPHDQFIILGFSNPENIKKNYAVYEKLKKTPNIKIYDKYVSIKKFNALVLNANLLFSDINVNYYSSDDYEIYGISKDSGISYLMNEFDKPCLLNKNFKNILELEKGTLYFNNLEELFNIYKKAKNKKFNRLLIENIQKDTINYNIDFFANRLLSEFDEINLSL